MKKSGIIVFFIILLLSSCAKKEEKVNDEFIVSQIGSKASENPKFPSYVGCTHIQKQGAGLSLTVQDCKVNNTQLTVNASDTLPGYFVETNTGSGFTAQALAIQIFDVGEIQSSVDAGNKVLQNLISQGYIKQDACKYEKTREITPNIIEGKLVKSSQETNCGDYEYSLKNTEKYFLVYKKEGKVLFINEQKKKKLFDVSSIKLLP